VKEKHTSLPSIAKKETALLQLIVAGSVNRVKRFWQFLKSVSGYRFAADYRLLFDHLDHQDEVHVVMQVEETDYLPVLLNRKENIVQIESTDGKNINIALLDVLVVEMTNGRVYIHGKSYDIFAHPIYDKQKEREVVECVVCEEEEQTQWN
jgi:hypothetical protein